MVQNTSVSASSPTTVEPIKRTQSALSFVRAFIFTRTKEFSSCPIKNPHTLARTIRGTNPKIASKALWFS